MAVALLWLWSGNFANATNREGTAMQNTFLFNVFMYEKREES